MNNPRLSVNIDGIELKNPVIAASGCYGYGGDYRPWVSLQEWGAITLKGTTLHSRQGNPPPRLVETPAGMINSVGLQNPGVDKVIAEELPHLQDENVAVIMNISGETIEEYVALTAKIAPLQRIDGIEVNVSCPNVEKGGISFGTDPESVSELVARVRSTYDGPLIVKLSPLGHDLPRVARAAEEAGAGVISLINTVPGMVIDADAVKPVLARGVGGLSGPAIRPVAVRAVWEVAGTVDIPLIGMGGIAGAEDALQFILAGARAVSIGTANFVNPLVVKETVAGIDEYMEHKGFKSMEEMCGAARR